MNIGFDGSSPSAIKRPQAVIPRIAMAPPAIDA